MNQLEYSPPKRIVAGPDENFWIWTREGGWDLTHPQDKDSEPLDTSVRLDCEVSNIVIDPAKTALVIIDMQNIALSQALGTNPSPAMYRAQDHLIQYGIPAARALGFQVVWLNWGLSEENIKTILPAEYRVFGFQRNSDKPDYGFSYRQGDPMDPDNFLKCGESLNATRMPGVELGEIELGDGTRINAGRARMKDTWNTALHGPLAPVYDEGKKAPRPDVWIDKNRNSGLWNGPSSECAKYFKKEGIRTLFFAGVNIDQCVGATLQDAHAQGYDTIMLKDGCATDSPEFAQKSYELNNIVGWGFLTSCRALAKAAGMDWGNHQDHNSIE